MADIERIGEDGVYQDTEQELEAIAGTGVQQEQVPAAAGGFVDFSATFASVCDVATAVLARVRDAIVALALVSAIPAAALTVDRYTDFDLVIPASFGFSQSTVANVAVDDSFVTPYETALDGDVSTNDTINEALPTYERNGIGPFFGDVVLDPDGLFTYNPDPGYTGADHFEYRIRVSTTANVSDAARVDIDVRGFVDVVATVAVSSAASAELGMLVWTPDEGTLLALAASDRVAIFEDSDYAGTLFASDRAALMGVDGMTFAETVTLDENRAATPIGTDIGAVVRDEGAEGGAYEFPGFLCNAVDMPADMRGGLVTVRAVQYRIDVIRPNGFGLLEVQLRDKDR